MKKDTEKKDKHLLQIENLQMRLEEAEETLHAIRNGEVDALVISGPQGKQVYTLKGADQAYRVLVETMTEGAATLMFDGTVLYCNSRLADMLGLPIEKTIGSSIFDHVGPDEPPRLKSMLRQSKTKTARAEFWFKKNNETLLPVLVSCNSLKLDNVGLCMVATDLTEQKKIEVELKKHREHLEELVETRTKELRKSEERLALAASSTQIGMFDWNLTGGSVLWTQPHEAIFGYAPATTTTTTTTEHDYRRWADRVHPDDLPLVEEESRRCRDARKPLEVQYRIIWPDGSLHWVETRGVFSYDSDGKADRILGVVMDITERKLAEDEILRYMNELKAMNEELTRFNRAAVDRELRIIELKKQVNELCAKAGEPARYPLDFGEEN